MTHPEPLTGEILNADGTPFQEAPPEPGPTAGEFTAAGRPLYWHVYGGPLAGSKGAAKNFPMITAGPVTKPADNEVVSTVIPGAGGETFSYLGTFDHDPSDAELRSLRPRDYR